MTFTGTKSDGTTVQRAFKPDNVLNDTSAFQTFTLTGFEDVVSVDRCTHDVHDAHQLDDVSVQAGGTLDATEIDLNSRAQATPGLTVRDHGVFEQAGGEYYVTFHADLSAAHTLPVNAYCSTEGGRTARRGATIRPARGGSCSDVLHVFWTVDIATFDMIRL